MSENVDPNEKAVVISQILGKYIEPDQFIDSLKSGPQWVTNWLLKLFIDWPTLFYDCPCLFFVET